MLSCPKHHLNTHLKSVLIPW